jgi:hypothetical protein
MLFVDHVNVATAAGVMQKELISAILRSADVPALRHKHSATTTFDREATKRAGRG